jgi:membrane protease YdiL (CAAX protease family)
VRRQSRHLDDVVALTMRNRGPAAALAAVALIAATLSLPWPPQAGFLLGAWAAVLIVVALGVFFAEGAGLLLFRRERWAPVLALSFAAGAVIGFALFGVLLLVARSVPRALTRLKLEAAMPLWKRVVIAFDSAALEEILFRLLILSALLWLYARIARRTPAPVVFWIANLVVAIGFGLAHLPSWMAVGKLTPAIAVMVVAMNSIGALVLGYAYWKRGLAAAMVMHFAADFALHAIGPMVLNRF